MAETTVLTRTAEIQRRKGPALSGEQHRRRSLLGALATAPLAVAAPALAIEAADPHLEWERELDRLQVELDAMPDDVADELRSPLYAECWRIEGLAMMTPATTMAELPGSFRSRARISSAT